MPAHLDETPLSDGLRRPQSVMGSRSRLQMLRCVSTRRDIDRQSIIDATGMALPSVRFVLVELEEMGYVTVDQSSEGSAMAGACTTRLGSTA